MHETVCSENKMRVLANITGTCDRTGQSESQNSSQSFSQRPVAASKVPSEEMLAKHIAGPALANNNRDMPLRYAYTYKLVELVQGEFYYK